MIKDIKFLGYSAQPSDYECADGDLSAAINLIPEDGALKPILPPDVHAIASCPDAQSVFIHKNSAYFHYIVIKPDGAVSWFDINNPDVLTSIGHVADMISVSAVGNTIIFLTDNGMQYYLWKGPESGYRYLGDKIPECAISFGLCGEMVRSDEFVVDTLDPSMSEEDFFKELSEETQNHITGRVLARVNKFIAENSVDKGKFIFPFFVRYAYRLYDGSLSMHSSPVLMIASSDVTPHVLGYIITVASVASFQGRVCAMVHKLDYQAISFPLTLIDDWGDIVRSVDIFISKPIYTYDQNGKCTGFASSDDYDSFCVCKHTNQAVSVSDYPLRYQKHYFNKLYAFSFSPSDKNCPPHCVKIPRRSLDDVKHDIESTAQFYLLKSIKPADLRLVRTPIDIPDDYLRSLVAREVMTDDYDSHDSLIPGYCFAYNSRLNIANISKRLYNKYNTAALVTFSDGFVSSADRVSPTFFDGVADTRIYIYIKQDGKDIIVRGRSWNLAKWSAPFFYLFYPNVNAYKAVIVKGTGSSNPSCYKIPLKPHDFLNGAFYFAGWDAPETTAITEPQASSDDARTVDFPNKIYTSEVNNPFLFPLLGINTVGTGRIKAISTAARALSQGQFGQFPLYAFTDEGVWALEVSSTGSYSARQPITRDVIIDNSEPLQMDSAVLFATDRGIMLIAGSQTQCITDTINTQDPFNLLKLPGVSELHSMIGHDADSCLPTSPFLRFISGCGMLYDYVHQRVFLYNPAYTYAYVYSLKSKGWGMIYSSIKAGINSYPEALALNHDGAILNFSTSQAHIVKGLMVTRPIKLETPDILKTIDTVIIRGMFQKGHVHTALYGSRDLLHWHLIWSSRDHYLRRFRGTPYKYFRIACVTNLADGECIFGASLQFNPRLTNQPR